MVLNMFNHNYNFNFYANTFFIPREITLEKSYQKSENKIKVWFLDKFLNIV